MRHFRWSAVAVGAMGVAFAAWQGGPLEHGGSLDDRSLTASAFRVGAQPITASVSAPTTAEALPANYYTLSAPVRFAPTEVTQYSDRDPISIESVAIGDVTGDGRDDLVMKAEAHEVWVIAQRANGTMDWAAPLVFDYDPEDPNGVHRARDYLKLGDINEDGILDILVPGGVGQGSFHGGITTLLSDGLGGFEMRYHFSQIIWEGPLVDVDLDGHLDAISVYSNPYCSSTCIYRRTIFGDGKGGFPREHIVDTGLDGPLQVRHPQAADLNDDGITDLAAVHEESHTSPDYMVVWFNDRAGSFTPPVRVLKGEPLSVDRTAFGDFNHDGKTDILSWYEQGIGVHQQTAPGVFAPVPLGPFRAWAAGFPTPHPADLDRNGTTDFLQGAFIPLQDDWVQVYLQLNGELVDVPERSRPGNNRKTNHTGVAMGDINGDGCTDVVQALGTEGLDYMLGNGCAPQRSVRNDFDGDHASDVLWHEATTNISDRWNGANIEQRVAIATGGSAWFLAATGDLDGDRRTDMVWRNRTTGANLVWRAGNHRTSLGITVIPDAAWTIVGAGDFDGDRKDDLLWRHTASGRNVYWPAGRSTATVTLPTVPDQAWRVAAIGDFDGDGRDDVFWRHATNGRNSLWKSATTPLTLINVGLAWQVVGAGDFDGDARSDLLWRNSSGANLLWRSADPATQLPLVAVNNAAWKVAAVGDYDNDARADILWRESSGRNVLWLRGENSRQRWVKSRAVDFAPVP